MIRQRERLPALNFPHRNTDDDVRVRAAAAWLDDTFPGWGEKIDLDNFQMEDNDRCIAAYLGLNDYWRALAVRYQDETHNDCTAVFASYTDEWVNEILLRRN